MPPMLGSELGNACRNCGNFHQNSDYSIMTLIHTQLKVNLNIQCLHGIKTK